MSDSKGIFSIGDRVRITNSYHWAKDALGTVKKPQSSEWLEGFENSCSRDIKSLRGIRCLFSKSVKNNAKALSC